MLETPFTCIRKELNTRHKTNNGRRTLSTVLKNVHDGQDTHYDETQEPTERAAKERSQDDSTWGRNLSVRALLAQMEWRVI